MTAAPRLYVGQFVRILNAGPDDPATGTGTIISERDGFYMIRASGRLWQKQYTADQLEGLPNPLSVAPA
jgi:hypothetical protein